MGNLDDHDPALSDAFASDREVILFNNAGVASSSGTVPGTIEADRDDIVIPTINSYVLQQFLPEAELILYPDANHGAHFQYPGLFVRHARIFLDD